MKGRVISENDHSLADSSTPLPVRPRYVPRSPMPAAVLGGREAVISLKISDEMTDAADSDAARHLLNAEIRRLQQSTRLFKP